MLLYAIIQKISYCLPILLCYTFCIVVRTIQFFIFRIFGQNSACGAYECWVTLTTSLVWNDKVQKRKNCLNIQLKHGNLRKYPYPTRISDKAIARIYIQFL